jgi:1-aminocyclopropane-1-carboxylate deaminase/D-cysteine desulfhydrase-like pyridoxal-dependent ACC family enzyme
MRPSTLKTYRKAIINDGWVDDLPPLVTEEVDGITVVREDKITGGSKARAADYFVRLLAEDYDELTYGGGGAGGYAQVAISYLARKYGMRAVIYAAKRKEENLSDQQREVQALGGRLELVPYGYLSVTRKRAKDYAEEDRRRFYLRMGLDTPHVLAAYSLIAERLDIEPSTVWVAGGSGTLTRGLQVAWPNAKHIAVSVGYNGDYGNATVIKSPLPFNRPAPIADRPPFPSSVNYDAKVWRLIKESKRDKRGITLFWNVGG